VCFFLIREKVDFIQKRREKPAPSLLFLPPPVWEPSPWNGGRWGWLVLQKPVSGVFYSR
jgi:hypothetical protein